MPPFKEKPIMSKKPIKATIKTEKGDINIRLFEDKVPMTVANFANLVLRKYYDGLKFHRVIENFMVQGGCPQGTGTGGPGYQFEDEFSEELKHNKPGILSMANAGPDSNGSQFFITHGPTPWLDGKHSIFGEVVGDKDLDVVNSISSDDTIISMTIEGNVETLFKSTLESVTVWNDMLDDEFPDLQKNKKIK